MSTPRLNRRLVLETRDRAPDGSGGYAGAWQTLGTLWAEVKARSGREALRVGGAVSLSELKITVRATPVGAASRPMPEQRFREGDRLFLIRAVAEHDADGRYLTCYATEERAV